MTTPSWDWLSEPLALDFANTVHWHSSTDVDHIDTLDGVHDWLAHEPHELPPVHRLDSETHGQLVTLRDASRKVLRHLVNGESPDPQDVEQINAAARRHPTILCINPHTLSGDLESTTASASALLGYLAATVIALITNPEEVARLGFCAAPNCGGLYRQSRPDQRWCHPDCGARARADRQYRRKKNQRNLRSGEP